MFTDPTTEPLSFAYRALARLAQRAVSDPAEGLTAKGPALVGAR